MSQRGIKTKGRRERFTGHVILLPSYVSPQAGAANDAKEAGTKRKVVGGCACVHVATIRRQTVSLSALPIGIQRRRGKEGAIMTQCAEGKEKTG